MASPAFLLTKDPIDPQGARSILRDLADNVGRNWFIANFNF